MNKRTFIEIGIASALGAVIGLSIAIALELPRWLWIPCGLVTFFCYRPREVYVVTREIVGELWQATCTAIRSARYLPNLSINWGKVRKVTTIIMQITGILAALWVGSAYADILIYLTASNPVPEGPVGAYVALIPFLSFLSAVIGGFLTLFYWMSFADGTKKSWFFPISTRLSKNALFSSTSKKKDDQKASPLFPIPKSELLSVSIFFLCLPLLAHLFIVLTFVLFLVDLAMTIVLACASTQRLAAIEGGTLGCAAGALVSYTGVSIGGELLIVGGIVGLIAGPYLYTLRMVLDRQTQTAPTA